MRASEILRLVWINIIGNKFKVMLTSLGIIVGAATIVMVIAIGKGGQADVEDQFKNLSAGAIDITYSGNATGMEGGFPGGMPSGGMMMAMPSGSARPSGGGGNRGGMGMMAFSMSSSGSNRVTLSKTDMDDLEFFISDIASATMTVNTKKDVTGGDLEEAAQYTIAGVTPSFADVSNLTVQMGDFLTDSDEETVQRVCVLGSTLATEMFGSPMAAYDSVIYIDGRQFVVNGVLDKMGSVTSGLSPDETIFVPFSAAKKYLMGRDMSPQITVVADSVSNVPQVMEDVATVLRESYPNAMFSITDAGSKMEAAAASANTLSMLLLAVASIVFIVGGIGIMNVLFVSVQERTREIGILKALGCRKQDILLEFLAEANVISCMGGVVGVLVSSLLMPLMQYTGMRVEPSATGLILALLFAVVTGTLFGFYPAMKAASLVPIEALNME